MSKWTAQRLREAVDQIGWSALSEEIIAQWSESIVKLKATHNAALAAERKEWHELNAKDLKRIDDLEQALAAEQETLNCQRGLNEVQYKTIMYLSKRIQELLDKVNNCEVVHRHRETIELLKEQLAAEREKVKPLIELSDEVAAWHRDKDSPDYNECDTAPCAWCDALEKVKEGK